MRKCLSVSNVFIAKPLSRKTDVLHLLFLTDLSTFNDKNGTNLLEGKKENS